MPYSASEGKQWAIDRLIEREPRTVLDVGAGAGRWGELLRMEHPTGRVSAETFAVEVWEPYVTEFDLRSKYDHVISADVRELLIFDFDCVIFGDVLEHMTRDDAIVTLERAALTAKTIVVSVPIIHMPQGAYEGNEYERHLHHWKAEEMTDVLRALPNTHHVDGVLGAAVGCWVWDSVRSFSD